MRYQSFSCVTNHNHKPAAPLLLPPAAGGHVHNECHQAMEGALYRPAVGSWVNPRQVTVAIALAAEQANTGGAPLTPVLESNITVAFLSVQGCLGAALWLCEMHVHSANRRGTETPHTPHKSYYGPDAPRHSASAAIHIVISPQLGGTTPLRNMMSVRSSMCQQALTVNI